MGLWDHPESEQSHQKQVHQSLAVTWRVSLSARLVRSTIPELWGLYAVCSCHLMFKALLTCYTKSATKGSPLSDPVLVGNPNLPKQAPGYF